jgi:putative colanic acid biosynthesis acetyltransferase WcaF
VIDVEQNRLQRKWTPKEQAGRILWVLVSPFFALSPRPLWGWRRFILRSFGARIAAHAHIYPTVRIAIPWNLDIGKSAAVGDRVILYSLGLITIGARATVSQGAHLCAGTHDWRDAAMPLLKKPITIGEDCWICADAFVGPDVTIGKATIIGARSVVMKDVKENVVGHGNPFRVTKMRDPRS